jgi:hypothetical protein
LLLLLVAAERPTTYQRSFALLLLLLLLQVGQSLDIEVLRGNAKEHVTAVLEANA